MAARNNHCSSRDRMPKTLQTGTTPLDDLWLVQLHRPYIFPDLFKGQDFALLLLTAGGGLTDNERMMVCDEIVRQRCRYVVCAGEECERWHDWIDETYAFATTREGTEPDGMTTTWHENESLESVLCFFRDCAVFDEVRPRRLLVLILGGPPAWGREVEALLGDCFRSQV